MYYGGYPGYGCAQQQQYYPVAGQGAGAGAAICLVLFILLVIILGCRSWV